MTLLVQNDDFMEAILWVFSPAEKRKNGFFP